MNSRYTTIRQNKLNTGEDLSLSPTKCGGVIQQQVDMEHLQERDTKAEHCRKEE